MYKIQLLLILVCFVSFSFAQNTQKKNGYDFDKTSFDFGEVEQWNNPAAVFTFTNRTKLEVTILPLFPARDLDVKVSKQTVLPNESITIEARYYTDGKGYFKREFPIYFNTSAEPIVLKITGNIKSLSPDAYLQCPPAHNVTENSKIPFLGDIAEFETEIPIPDANIYIVSLQKVIKLNAQSNAKGLFDVQLTIGNYSIQVNHPGYLPYEKTIYIGVNTSRLSIRLIPIIEEEVIVESAQEEDDTIYIVQNAVENIEDPILEKTVFIEEAFFNEETVVIDDDNETNQEEFFISNIEEEAALNSEQKKVDSLNQFIAEILEKNKTIENQLLQIQAENEDKERKKLEKENLAIRENTLDNNTTALAVNKYSANNIIFLIDVSTSMEKNEKIDMLKYSIKRLVSVLRDIDNIAIIAYNQQTSIVLESVNGNEKERILFAIDSLKTGGLTNGVKGIQTAYEMLSMYYKPNGNNQIILATDGLFSKYNNELTESELNKLVKKNAEFNQKLSVVGFGNNEEGIEMMQKLAKNGSGQFIAITKERLNQDVLINEIKLNSEIKY